MKLTKQMLRQVIIEEGARLLGEYGAGYRDQPQGWLGMSLSDWASDPEGTAAAAARMHALERTGSRASEIEELQWDDDFTDLLGPQLLKVSDILDIYVDAYKTAQSS